MQMMRVADSRWLESLQQQQASTQWNEALKTRAQSSPQLRGWLQTRQGLTCFCRSSDAARERGTNPFLYQKMSSGRRSGDWGRKHPLSLC